MDLSFEHDPRADFICNFASSGRIVSYFSPGNLNAILAENLFGLILMNFHCIYPFLWDCFAPAGLAMTHEESSLLVAMTWIEQLFDDAYFFQLSFE